MEYLTFNELIGKPGLKMVVVQGTPSPWSQAAKAMMEYKGLDFHTTPWMPGAPNDEIVAWGGEASAPVVQWQNEKPINKWNEILFLLERLAPEKPLVPNSAAARAKMVGIANEIMGPLGIGWNRRLQLFQPLIDSGQAPEGVMHMGEKYGYNQADASAAGERLVDALNFLSKTLQASGGEYFVGNELSAADFYWASMCNIIKHMPYEQCPTAEGFRPLFEQIDPKVEAALSADLLAHRDRMMQAHFVIPMEL